MTIEISDPGALKMLASALAARPDATPEEVVGAAIGLLHEADAETDRTLGRFPQGELDRLLAEGEASGEPLDGDEAYQARCAARAERRLTK